MVFKLGDEKKLDFEIKNRVIKKTDNFTNKIIFVNGFGGSGKTMLSPIISSMERVEQLIYPYEIQWLSSFFYSSKIDENSYIEFLRAHADLTIYNSMMGRNSNFRISDISSVLQSSKKFEYIKRIFKKGDDFVLQKISLKKPIINYTTTDLIFFINEIGKAFGERVLFIETLRDPLYMFEQAKIKHENVHTYNKVKNFSFSVIENKKDSFFFDYFQDSKKFRETDKKKSNQQIISYLERIFNFYFNLDFSKIDMNKGKLMFIPFEKFVVNPNDWINEIIKILDIKKDKSLSNEMKKQKVPRNILNDGYERSIYKKYDQYPVKKKFPSTKLADEDYRLKIESKFDERDKELFQRLIRLSDKYKNWIDTLDKKKLIS